MKFPGIVRVGLAVLLGLLCLSPALTESVTVSAAPYNTPINHIVVLYMENRSFDNLYGLFPGADGLSQAGAAANQVDKNGKVYDKLPDIINTNLKPAAIDTRFPAGMANQPFQIDKYVPANQATGDLVHRYYQEQVQIDGGKMDKFASVSDAGGLVMGYYDGNQLPLWQYAKQYTLSDHFFHGAFGGSFLNHFWLVCACSPRWDNAPTNLVAQVDASGNMVKDGQVSPDGFAINTSQSVFMPHNPAITDTKTLVPPQTMPHIGDKLDEKGVSWAWYSGGWNDALAGKADPLFQFHHQPMAFFKDLGDGTPGRTQHLKDETQMFTDIQNNTLPAVTFWKPIGANNSHPGYTDVLKGDQYAADIIKKIQGSQMWKDTAIILTYDEHGGLWDHVAPPKMDKWGPGTRIPTIIVSPYAKKGFVDHTTYDTTSILKFIETRYGIQPLGDRDAKIADFTNAFDFSQATGQGGAAGPAAAPATGGGGTTSPDAGLTLRWIAGFVVVAGVSYYSLARLRPNRKSSKED